MTSLQLQIPSAPLKIFKGTQNWSIEPLSSPILLNKSSARNKGGSKLMKISTIEETTMARFVVAAPLKPFLSLLALATDAHAVART